MNGCRVVLCVCGALLAVGAIGEPIPYEDSLEIRLEWPVDLMDNSTTPPRFIHLRKGDGVKPILADQVDGTVWHYVAATRIKEGGGYLIENDLGKGWISNELMKELVAQADKSKQSGKFKATENKVKAPPMTPEQAPPQTVSRNVHPLETAPKPKPIELKPVLISHEGMKKTDDSYSYVNYSWKARLYNPNAVPRKGRLQLKLFDRQNYLLESDSSDVITIAPHSKAEGSDKSMIKSDLWERITKYEITWVQW